MSFFRNGSLCCLALLGAACSGNDGRTELSWRVVRQADPNDPAPGIAGVKVCVDGRDDVPCVTTDSAGNFTLYHVPAGADLVLVLDKDGYVPSLKPLTTSFEPSHEVAQPISMLKNEDVPTSVGGIPVDAAGKGSIDFFVIVRPEDDAGLAGPLPGATAVLAPVIDAGAVYFGKPGVLDPSLKATLSSGGNFLLGTVTSGRFFNVPAGTYTLSFTGPSKYICSSFGSPSADWGFPVDGEAAVRVPVREGYNTANVGVYCKLK